MQSGVGTQSTLPSPTPNPNSMRAPAPDPAEVKPPAPKNGLPPVVYKIDTNRKVVFLTIDDGYTKDPKVVEVFRDRDIPVTPFLTKNAIGNDRKYFQEVVDLTGQFVQDHTVSHRELTLISESEQESEICGAAKTYEEWFGKRPWMLRPPYGSWNSTVQAAAKQCGMQYVVHWSTTVPTSQIRYQVGSKLRPGDIILTHWRPDLYRHLPGVLDDIKKQGFKIGALQDWLPER